jgi:hypothetical protein
MKTTAQIIISLAKEEENENGLIHLKFHTDSTIIGRVLPSDQVIYHRLFRQILFKTISSINVQIDIVYNKLSRLPLAR